MTEKELKTTKDHETTKTNRQADVLDQARLRPHMTSLRPKILSCLIKIRASGLSEATARLLNCRLPVRRS